MTKIYTYEYDNDYSPAMPVVDIVIGRAMGAASLALKALVDSGADATIIPVHSLQEIRARRSRKMWMSGTTGGRVLVDLYQVSLQLGPLTQALLEVVGSTQNDEVIVGRDVLNHLTVTLNGPAHSVEVFEDIVPT
ncbi:MAG: retroviral-like aspartic protease family protein [Anaerolineaceae bacterium]|nr:retroviral-like aspartic protease family protein [Anaerolineaceae bacterium]